MRHEQLKPPKSGSKRAISQRFLALFARKRRVLALRVLALLAR